MDSDIDLVVLADTKRTYIHDDRWIIDAVGEEAPVVRRLEWGPATERRVRLSSGLEVEFVLVSTSWAKTDPPDAGTARVVGDGCVPLVDRHGDLRRLLSAVAGTA